MQRKNQNDANIDSRYKSMILLGIALKYQDALKAIANLSDGNQEYNASQFQWAKMFAQEALDGTVDEIAKGIENETDTETQL